MVKNKTENELSVCPAKIKIHITVLVTIILQGKKRMSVKTLTTK